MPLLIVLVLVIVIGCYLYFRSKDKFTRGGDINRQGEDMDGSQNGHDDPENK